VSMPKVPLEEALRKLDELEELKTEKVGTFWGNPVIAFWGRDPQNGTWEWGVIIEKTTQKGPLPFPLLRLPADHVPFFGGDEAHREEEAREMALELARKLRQP